MDTALMTFMMYVCAFTFFQLIPLFPRPKSFALSSMYCLATHPKDHSEIFWDLEVDLVEMVDENVSYACWTTSNFTVRHPSLPRIQCQEHIVEQRSCGFHVVRNGRQVEGDPIGYTTTTQSIDAEIVRLQTSHDFQLEINKLYMSWETLYSMHTNAWMPSTISLPVQMLIYPRNHPMTKNLRFKTSEVSSC